MQIKRAGGGHLRHGQSASFAMPGKCPAFGWRLTVEATSETSETTLTRQRYK
jgi:hypothetical protein